MPRRRSAIDPAKLPRRRQRVQPVDRDLDDDQLRHEQQELAAAKARGDVIHTELGLVISYDVGHRRPTPSSASGPADCLRGRIAAFVGRVGGLLGPISHQHAQGRAVRSGHVADGPSVAHRQPPTWHTVNM